MIQNPWSRIVLVFILAFGAFSATASEDENAVDSVRKDFLSDCDTWFWDCECLGGELFPEAVRSLREERHAKKVEALQKACDENSWDSLKFHLHRVLTSEEFERLGVEAPAGRRGGGVPSAGPCEVKEKLEGVSAEEFVDVPDPSHIWLEVASEAQCRNAEGIRDYARKKCERLNPRDAYDCDCYADHYRDFWMSGDRPFSSGLDIQVSSDAMTKCRLES